jgi:hypothetical protein
MTNSKAMSKLMTYAYNFNYNFIEDCWKDDPSLANHLKNKWNGIVGLLNKLERKFNGTDVWFLFYMELDEANKDLLNQYILQR